jgi:2-polyprenyl-3-methyl-5-hydroxy-6-metoxy-1,4-benzoquinol methylase
MEQLNFCLACDSPNHSPFIQTSAIMHRPSPVKYNFDICADCGLVFLNPRVPLNEMDKFYTASYLPYRVEEAWGKYAAFVKKDQLNIDNARLRRVKKHHELTSSSRILDVGCGKPTFLACLRKASSSQVVGIDFSDEGWASNPDSYKGIELRKGEVANLESEQPFDVITMWHYLEHDYHPKRHLRQLLNIAHPETRLIVEVPNFDSFTRKKFGYYWAGYHTPRHTALYSPASIEVLMKNSGWQVEQLYTYGTLDPYTLHWMSRMEQQGIDWSASMESRFLGYVADMLLNAPIYKLQKIFSLGFLTVVAKPA